MNNKTIVAVIVTRNRLVKLKSAYEKIACQPVNGIVIVDNLSSDGTSQWLDSLDESKLLVYHSNFKWQLRYRC